MENKQLFEKQSNSYKPIYPLVRLEDIVDTISDKSIQWILNNYNHIYVEYSESKAVTRNKVPQLLRRTGIWISYNAGTEVVTEYYKGDNKDVTNFIKWTNDDNWERFDKIKHLDGSINYQHLSESLRQLIGQGNNITNFPDDEDLEVKDGLLKLKDRDFEPNNFSGLGRVILRKNIKAVDGQPKNILTQDMFTQSNTIYEIRYDFDLNGAEITIPEGCVLDFQGGSFSNGTIVGNKTSIDAGLTKIFGVDIELNGNWCVLKAYPEWFGAKINEIIDNSEALSKALQYFNTLYLQCGIYYTNPIIIPSFRKIQGCGKATIIRVLPSSEKSSKFLLETKDGGSGITLSDFKLQCGNSSYYNDYLIGGIHLKSTSNDVLDLWDSRNTIRNIEILYSYSSPLHIDSYHRGCDISHCWISHSTNIGINCLGTDNSISECIVASTHNSGIVLQTNNKLNNSKLFGCGASTELENIYALDIIGNKCAVSNIEIQQNYWGACRVRGNSNYVQIVDDNNGSGNTNNTTVGINVTGSYNTIIATCANFTFHDDKYERYYLSTNWNTVGNNIIINGEHLSNNYMAILAPWVKDNITNNVFVNGHYITNDRKSNFNKYKQIYKYTSNGTGTINNVDGNIVFNLTSSTKANTDSLLAVVPIPKKNIDNNGVISVKASFQKIGDSNLLVYPYMYILLSYIDVDGITKTRTEVCNVINKVENNDNIYLYIVSALSFITPKVKTINSINLYVALRTLDLISNSNVTAVFSNIQVGAKKTDNSLIKFINEIGVSNDRPSDILSGFQYFDTTLNKPIYWTGSKWVDATGAEV